MHGGIVLRLASPVAQWKQTLGKNIFEYSRWNETLHLEMPKKQKWKNNYGLKNILIFFFWKWVYILFFLLPKLPRNHVRGDPAMDIQRITRRTDMAAWDHESQLGKARPKSHVSFMLTLHAARMLTFQQDPFVNAKHQKGIKTWRTANFQLISDIVLPFLENRILSSIFVQWRTHVDGPRGPV